MTWLLPAAVTAACAAPAVLAGWLCRGAAPAAASNPGVTGLDPELADAFFA
jgi:hypothetical protein